MAVDRLERIMTRRGGMLPEEQQQILREVGGALLQVVPADWTEIRFTMGVTAELTSTQLEAVLDNGEVIEIAPPNSPRIKLRELRAGMYHPGKGTWFTARYVIQRPTRYSVDFDFDNEPDFGMDIGFQPVPQTYTNDLKAFPRDDDHIPTWLRQKIKEAEE
ncbi:hypothetical protein [Actinomadura pelletieri]|nr:hypothetical protein [Actinomadura pelletieri]